MCAVDGKHKMVYLPVACSHSGMGHKPRIYMVLRRRLMRGQGGAPRAEASCLPGGGRPADPKDFRTTQCPSKHSSSASM